jgi:flagellar motor protein MotB
MMGTYREELQNLTLRYSKELSALQNRFEKDLEKLEEEKYAALKTVKGTEKPFRDYRKAIDAADNTFEKAAGKAETAREDEKEKCLENRYKADAENEGKYRVALLKALERKTEACERAGQEHEKAMEKARAARAEALRFSLEGAAHEAYRAALDKANAEYGKAVAQAAEDRKDGFNTILEQEYGRITVIEKEYRARISKAEKDRDLSFAEAGTLLMQALNTLPEASAILLLYEQKVLELKKSNAEKKAALEKKFREELARLKKRRKGLPRRRG